MNKKGGFLVGTSLLLVFFIFALILFVTIEPFKENLDVIRGGDALNCKGTATFNQTAFDDDQGSTINKLTKRPTCFITGITMIWFIFGFLFALVAWLADQWTRKRKRVT